jgi:hypothetical protein
MKNARAMQGSRPQIRRRAMLTCLVASLVTTSYATPVTVTVRIPEVRLISGSDPFGDDELYSRVNINQGGAQQSGIVTGVADGETIRPNWSFMSTVDPRGLQSYNIPISMELWDDDSPQRDEQIDINPGPGRTLPLTYNLETRRSSLSSPQTGNVNPRATIHFVITSDPFQYLFDVIGQPTFLGGNLWEYNYELRNLAATTFDIDRWVLPGIGTFTDLSLQPGGVFNPGPFRSTIFPAFSFSTVLYDDLRNTSRTRQLLLPVSEPGSMAVFGIGLIALGIARQRKHDIARRRKHDA